MALLRATVRCAFPIGSGGGTNTWHLRTTGDEAPFEEVAGLMGLVEDFYTSLAGAVRDGYQWSWDGTAVEIANPEPGISTGNAPWTVNGDNSEPWSAAANMMCVTWRTPLASRSGRGRTFIGPIAASAVGSDGTVTDTTLTNARQAAADLVTASNGFANGSLVVFSPTDGIARDFTGSSITDQVAILRSRR